MDFFRVHILAEYFMSFFPGVGGGKKNPASNAIAMEMSRRTEFIQICLDVIAPNIRDTSFLCFITRASLFVVASLGGR